jgi:GNAT superfamily N-acetyltransferase
MNIRYANEDDAKLLTDMGRKTFYDTFAEQNTPQDMELYLSATFSVEKQASEIQDPNSLFLILEVDGIAVGFARLMAYSTAECISAARPMELQRIYVQQGHIGKGAGAELMKAAIRETKERGFDCLWLGVWEKNTRAQKFYEKWGFKNVGVHTFLLGTDPQTDFIMELVSPFQGDVS